MTTEKELIKRIMEGQSIVGFANKMLLVEKAIKEAQKGMIKIEDMNKVIDEFDLNKYILKDKWKCDDLKEELKQSLQELGEKGIFQSKGVMQDSKSHADSIKEELNKDYALDEVSEQ
jgi:hypothetical protein